MAHFLATCVVVVAVRSGGGYAVWWFQLNRARSALSRHDAAGAMVWIEFSRRLRDNHTETHFLAARAARRLGDSDAMIEHINRAHGLGFLETRLNREVMLAEAQVDNLERAER